MVPSFDTQTLHLQKSGGSRMPRASSTHLSLSKLWMTKVVWWRAPRTLPTQTSMFAALQGRICLCRVPIAAWITAPGCAGTTSNRSASDLSLADLGRGCRPAQDSPKLHHVWQHDPHPDTSECFATGFLRPPAFSLHLGGFGSPPLSSPLACRDRQS